MKQNKNNLKKINIMEITSKVKISDKAMEALDMLRQVTLIFNEETDAVEDPDEVTEIETRFAEHMMQLCDDITQLIALDIRHQVI